MADVVLTALLPPPVLAGRRPVERLVGAGALLACLYAVADFGAVSILRYDTLATAIYSQYRFSFDRSGAASLAILLLGLALLTLACGLGHELLDAVIHGRSLDVPEEGTPVVTGHLEFDADLC